MSKRRKSPCVVFADQLAKNWDTNKEVTLPGGRRKWVPCRPSGDGRLWTRLKLGIAVFRGRADALFWTEQ